MQLKKENHVHDDDENTSRPRSLDSSPRALASLSNYTRLVRTDMSPCERPLRPRGTAATTRPTLAQPQGRQQPFVGGGAVRRHVRLRGFNWNGWSKGCGNASRGTTFEPGAGDSFYLTPSVAACRMCSRCMCPAYVFYPAEEPSEANGGAGRCLLPTRAEAAALRRRGLGVLAPPEGGGGGAGWAVLAPPEGGGLHASAQHGASHTYTATRRTTWRRCCWRRPWTARTRYALRPALMRAEDGEAS